MKKYKKSSHLLETIITIENKLKRLKPLSSLEKAKLDNEIALEHLYYSNELEGTHLT